MVLKNQNQSLGFTVDNSQHKPLPPISKSKRLASRQCLRHTRREVHRTDAQMDSPAAQACFRSGHHVGEVARHKYEPILATDANEPCAQRRFKAQALSQRSLFNSGAPVIHAEIQKYCVPAIGCFWSS